VVLELLEVLAQALILVAVVLQLVRQVQVLTDLVVAVAVEKQAMQTLLFKAQQAVEMLDITQLEEMQLLTLAQVAVALQPVQQQVMQVVMADQD
jgi:hypothetical protein